MISLLADRYSHINNEYGACLIFDTDTDYFLGDLILDDLFLGNLTVKIVSDDNTRKHSYSVRLFLSMKR